MHNKALRYRVYFEQINQTYVEVRAVSEKEARQKAKKEWYEENQPQIIEIVEDV